MGKFNTARETKTRATNLAGGEAFVESPKLELVSHLLTSFVKNQFYRSEDKGLERLNELLDVLCKKDALFVAKAAIYARTKFGMRSVSHVVAGEIAKRVKGEQWTKNFYSKVVHRVDDMNEILAYYLSKHSKPIPNSLKKGFALAIKKFDAYQLAKYRKEDAAVKLVDIVNLCHPKGSDHLKNLVEGTLKSTETWEAKLSKTGQVAETEEEKEELKGEAWKELILSKKIPYFALLRNLRNILEQAPEIVPQACEILTNEYMIRKSLVLPFRFVTALREVEKLRGSTEILIALNKAVDIACSNAPVFDGETLVVLDTSGSMMQSTNQTMQMSPAQIGALFAAVLIKTNRVDFMTFSDDAKYHTMNPIDSTLTIAQSIPFASGGTNFPAIFKRADRAYDRVIILSDMQGWMCGGQPSNQFSDYKRRTNCNPKIYSFDLQGLGSLQFPESNVYAIAGFSDKVFDLMKMLETDRRAIITEIERVEI